MATNIEEALSGGGLSVSAKPVTMEALPEATIDVAGGSQSLAIEGLGVKRKKDDLSVTTSSTSQIAMQDLFGDLLDEVNFSDPSSVDAFRSSAQTRIDEMDLDSASRVLGTASSVASDINTLASPFLDRDSSQNQFQQVLGPPAPTSVTDSGGSGDFDSGLDTATSTEAQDISDLSNPGLAAGLVGGVLGGGFSGLANSISTGAISSAVSGIGVDVFGGFNAVSDLSNAEISNPGQAIGAVAAALEIGQTAANIAAFAQRGKSLDAIFEDVTTKVEEYVEGIVSAFSNPAQALEAYGLQATYGTMTPDLYSFDFPGGKMSFAFDAKTGAVAVPGMISSMLGMKSGLGAAYDLAQFGLDKLGYSDAMADRNQSAINAFSMPGVQLGAMSIHNSNLEALTGIDPTTGAASTVGAFGALDMSQAGFGMVGFDLGAIADAIGTGTIGDLSFTDYQDAAISGHLGHGPMGFDTYDEGEALAESMAADFSNSGLETAQDIADMSTYSAEVAASFAYTLGTFGIDVISEPEGIGALDRGDALASSRAARNRDAQRESPVDYLAAAMFENYAKGGLGPNLDRGVAQKQAEQAHAADFVASLEAAGQQAAMDYNSQAPNFDVVEAMQQLGLDYISMNAYQMQQEKAALGLQMAINKAAKSDGPGGFSGMEGATGSFSAGFGSMSAQEAQGAYNEEALSGLDDMSGFGTYGGYTYGGYNIGDAEAAADVGPDMSGTLGSMDPESNEGSDSPDGPGSGDEGGTSAGPGGMDSSADDADSADSGTGSGGPGAPGGMDSSADDADSADSGTGSGGAGAPGATDSSADDADSADSGTGSADCFVQGTLVLMAEGSTKAIEKVVVGDLVAGKDGKANKVEATHIKKPDIPFLYGFNGHKPFVTAYHPFMTKEGWGCFEPQKFKEHRPTAYQEIANEQGGKDLIKIENNCELLRSDNQWVLVEDIVVEGCDPNLAVYNLSVANDKTFVANNYIVHNKGESGKIICTAMNNMYGFGSYRNALWMKYQSSHMAAEEYELGYHKLVMPLVKKMPTNKTIRTVLERIAKRRTINIRKELRGQKLPLYYRSMKYTVRPLLFAVGWLVKKNLLSKTEI